MKATSVKARFSTSVRFLCVLCLAVLAVAPRASAQTPPILGVQLYAGLSITGTVGMVYQVQYITNLTQTNAWLPLTNLTLASNPQLWVDTTCPATGRRFYRAVVTNEVPANMVLIPAGSFTMGNSIGDSDITDAATVTANISAFYMDTNLVSYSQWQGVYSWATSHGYGFVNVGAGKAANHPVQTVDWYDCVKWCNARSQQAGLTPVYYTDAGLTQVFRNGDDPTTVYQNLAANGYRLPTEAEWEKAARGGLSGQRFPLGNTISESQANYDGYPNPPNSGGYTYDLGPYTGYNANFATGGYPYTSPVGYFAANGYGLYDMAGNVLEWCWDWYGTPYGQPTTTNPTGAGPGSGNRVMRGGCWINLAYYARCACRVYVLPNYAYAAGFRCVRGL